MHHGHADSDGLVRTFEWNDEELRYIATCVTLGSGMSSGM